MNEITEPGGTRIELGKLSDLEAVDKLMSVDSLSVIEVGCGNGESALGLAERGATVLGIEPDPVQAARNRETPSNPRVTLLETGAEALPADDDSIDGVFMFRSLHHVPKDLMDSAITEAFRVVLPNGFLYVAEPAMKGSFYRMMLPFHDERSVRTSAQKALLRTAEKQFTESAKYSCFQQQKFDDFEAMIDRFTSMSYNQITRDMIDCPEVRESFEAANTGDGYVFKQPMLINLYRGT